MTTTTPENNIATNISDHQNSWKAFYAQRIAEIKKDKGHWVDQGLSTTASSIRTIGHALMLSAAFCVFVFTILFITYDGTNITIVQAQFFAKITLIASFGAALAVCLSVNTGKFKSLKRKVAIRYANNMNEIVKQRDFIDQRIENSLKRNGLIEVKSA